MCMWQTEYSLSVFYDFNPHNYGETAEHREFNSYQALNNGNFLIA